MKRFFAFLLLILLPLSALAADNLVGLDTKGKQVVVRDGLSLAPFTVTGNSTVSGASYVKINRATNATATITFTPAVGQLFAITQADAHIATATVSLPTGWTWNGTNKSTTFNAAAETIIGFCPYANRVIIVENIGSVGFAD